MQAEDVQKATLGDLIKVTHQAHEAQHKYSVIFDKNGNVARFFSYKACLLDFHKEIIRVRMGAQTHA